MKIRPSRLPPLNALRAFEAAGRHLSFRDAAAELNVTPAAVSQQIKALEGHLDMPLFVRLNRALELTPAGRALLPGLTDGFDRLAQAFENFRHDWTDRPLTVSVVPVFGARWLLWRLDGFRTAHPEIDIRLDATARVVDFTREQVDIAVRYGTGEYPGLRADCLLVERVFPVCSPALLNGLYPLREPADLRHHVLLRSESSPRYPTWPDWPTWLRAAGVADLEVTYSPIIAGETDALILGEAVAGRGVALASSVLAGDDLAAGRLVKPFDVAVPVDFCYWVVCPETTAEAPRIRVFREWLLQEVARSCSPDR